MRRKDLEVTDRGRIRDIFEACPIVHLGLVDKGEPYVVPMNYGLDMDEANCVLYFHSALEGRKIDAMRENPRVCVEACQYLPPECFSPSGRRLRYRSVIGWGTASIVEDPEEKARGLACIGEKSGRGGKGCSARKMARVCVFKITVDSLTGKEH